MSAVTTVSVHSSQYPEQVARDLAESLRRRQVNHKFHYDSPRQTLAWLKLHEALSPARTDPDCVETYDRGFSETALRVRASGVRVIGLGCGGGKKDLRLLQLLRESGKTVTYTPADVSVAMVLVATQLVEESLPECVDGPLVCDLATTDDLSEVLGVGEGPNSARLITFFGMIPNFEPGMILPKLAALVRPGDSLLFSANLAPGPDYAAGVEKVLPLYDNALTRDWLMEFLLGLGFDRNDGIARFRIESDPGALGLKRITAGFEFLRPREVTVGGETFAFAAREQIQLFFSYRHTPELVRSMLGQVGLSVREQWITRSEEEGVFLVQKG